MREYSVIGRLSLFRLLYFMIFLIVLRILISLKNVILFMGLFRFFRKQWALDKYYWVISWLLLLIHASKISCFTIFWINTIIVYMSFCERNGSQTLIKVVFISLKYRILMKRLFKAKVNFWNARCFIDKYFPLLVTILKVTLLLLMCFVVFWMEWINGCIQFFTNYFHAVVVFFPIFFILLEEALVFLHELFQIEFLTEWLELIVSDVFIIIIRICEIEHIEIKFI